MSEYDSAPDGEFDRLTQSLEIGTKEQATARLMESYGSFDQLAHTMKKSDHVADEWIEVRQEDSPYGIPITTTFENWEQGSVRIEQHIGRGTLEFDVKHYGRLCFAKGYMLREEGIKLPLALMSDTQVLLYMAMLIDDIKTQVHDGTARLEFR